MYDKAILIGEIKHDAGHVEERAWDGREIYHTFINKKFLKSLKGRKNNSKTFLKKALRSN